MIEFLSEIAPATASAIAQLLPKYLDQVQLFSPIIIQILDIQACIKVVEGGVPETTALLKVICHSIAPIKSCFYVFKNIFHRSVLTTSSTLEARLLEGLLGGWENFDNFLF